jgi:hypothetical protein
MWLVRRQDYAQTEESWSMSRSMGTEHAPAASRQFLPRASMILPAWTGSGTVNEL